MKPEKGRIRLLTTVPGAERLEPLLSDFAKGGAGIVTSFSERLLRVASGLESYDDLEFLPFGDVVSRFLLATGGDSKPLATGGLVLEAVNAVRSELPEDSPFARAARFRGAQKAIIRTLEELHEADIHLGYLAQNHPGAMGGKLTSLALLDRAVRLKLDSLGRTTLSELIRECLDGEMSAKLDRLLVFAGSGMCLRNLKWLEWAARTGSKVTLVLERHATEKMLFSPSKWAIEELAEQTSSVGTSNGLLDSLFTDRVEPGPRPQMVQLIAADRFAECEWTLRECLKERAVGTRAGRIGIFARNLEEYAPLLDTVSKRMGLPLSIARRVPLMSNRFARLVSETLAFCSGSDVRILMSVVRSSYVQLSLENQNLAWTALRECYNQRENQWESLETWSSGAGESFSWLKALIEWRKDALQQRSGLQEWIGRLRGLIDLLPTNPFDSVPTSGRDSRAQTALQRPLYHLASVDAERYSRLALTDFQAVCTRIWADADVSLPETNDAITVVDSADALGAVEVLFVLGMLEGVFPRRRSEDPILSDSERGELNSLARRRPPQGGDVPEGQRGERESSNSTEAISNNWLQDSHQKAQEERDEFYRLCAAASRKLFLSYPETDDQRDNVPAFYLTEVERAAGGRDKIEFRQPPRTTLVPVEDLLSEADRKLGEALAAHKSEPIENRLESIEATTAIAWPDDKLISPRELSEVLDCPFRFFARRRLNLRTTRPASKWGSLRRLPQSVGLTAQPNEAAARAALEAALEVGLGAMLADLAPWELSALRAGATRMIRDWVQREFASRKHWAKTEGSLRRDLDFESEGYRSKVSSKLQIRGRVAAASNLGKYKVSHLYESRAPERDRDDPRLEDPDFVYYGLHLLAQYEPGVGSALEVETMSTERLLFVLTRLPGAAIPGNASQGLRVIDLSTRDDSRESVKDFFDELKMKANLAAQKIREIEIHANPGPERCAWCDMGELCRKSGEFGEEDLFGF